MTNTEDIIRKSLDGHSAAVSSITENQSAVADIAERIAKSLRGGGKILLCGNGGSAADAQHVAAELIGRFKLERRAWPAIALTTNSSIVTAIGNDYGFDFVFSRQVEALAKKEDVVVGISTSGNSRNVLNAMSEAKKVGCATIGVTGKNGGELAKIADVCFRAGSDDTPRVQEAHILMWHIVCELVEQELPK